MADPKPHPPPASTEEPTLAIDGDLLTRALRQSLEPSAAGHGPAPERSGLGHDSFEPRGVGRGGSGAAGWLLQHRDGQLQAELTEALANVLLACAENEKPGEITLKIRVSTNPDVPGQMILSDQVSVKLPPRATAMPYLFDPDAMRICGERQGQLSIPLAE